MPDWTTHQVCVPSCWFSEPLPRNCTLLPLSHPIFLCSFVKGRQQSPFAPFMAGEPKEKHDPCFQCAHVCRRPGGGRVIIPGLLSVLSHQLLPPLSQDLLCRQGGQGEPLCRSPLLSQLPACAQAAPWGCSEVHIPRRGLCCAHVHVPAGGRGRGRFPWHASWKPHQMVQLGINK